jgi:3-deoxy-D-arabino-heptulosonate 7-phosphate (DAHP) synthase
VPGLRARHGVRELSLRDLRVAVVVLPCAVGGDPAVCEYAALPGDVSQSVSRT